MPSDVSLCVIRIETSKNEKPVAEIKNGKTNEDRVSVLRGRRQICNISVETICLIDDDMAEGGDKTGFKPLCPTSDKVPDKDSIHFSSGNPFVEKTTGIIHLFKEDSLTSIERATNRSQMVCILAVPSTMSCTDLLNFMAPCRQDIKHVRIIKDGSPNQYMALLNFRSSESVEEFYKSYNGIPFSMIEPELCCHLVFVSRVEILSEAEGGSVPPVDHTELPICAVCLERMDESVDGILTIMCNHTFHGQCLTKWGDSSCPVCRYVQTPEPQEESFCFQCMAKESLWICLICGHVGCGRYVEGHAYQHYLDTHHCYSMQLGNNRVWDYVGDNFVHRILQNKADGKLVEGTGPTKTPDEEGKLDSLQLEYTYLLTSQLESQREYYENLILTMENQNTKDNNALKQTCLEYVKQHSELKAKTEVLMKEKVNIEKKLQATSNRLNFIQKQLEDEKQLNNAMCENQTVWQNKCKDLQRELIQTKITKEQEIKELNEQLRDIMFYLEAEKTVNSSPHKDELKEGKLEVGPSPSSSTSKHSKKRSHTSKTEH